MNDEFKKILKFCLNWIIGESIDWHENKGLRFFGEIGLGKSCIIKAINNLVKEIYPFISSKYITANKIASYFRNSGDDSDFKLNEILSCRLLFIDDIGTEDNKVFNSYPIQEIIRERYDRKKITSFTTNKETNELIKLYNESIVDKMFHGTYLIPFTGKSLRT